MTETLTHLLLISMYRPPLVVESSTGASVQRTSKLLCGRFSKTRDEETAAMRTLTM